MMREEKLFSGIYIVGTALAIAFTMVMAVVYYAMNNGVFLNNIILFYSKLLMTFNIVS